MKIKIKKMSRERQVIYIARVVSVIFTPFYLPVVGLAILFIFSYFRSMPLNYQLFTLAMVYLLTCLLPTFLIHLYRRYQGWSLIELGHRERRMVPYIISILCYYVCVYLMESMRMPHFMGSIVVAALFVQIFCAIINVWWKISVHTAAIGGVAGAVFVFAELFGFNPVWWMCLIFLVAGLLGTSRMILRQHSLLQVVGGFFIGFFAATAAVLI